MSQYLHCCCHSKVQVCLLFFHPTQRTCTFQYDTLRFWGDNPHFCTVDEPRSVWESITVLMKPIGQSSKCLGPNFLGQASHVRPTKTGWRWANRNINSLGAIKLLAIHTAIARAFVAEYEADKHTHSNNYTKEASWPNASRRVPRIHVEYRRLQACLTSDYAVRENLTFVSITTGQICRLLYVTILSMLRE